METVEGEQRGRKGKKNLPLIPKRHAKRKRVRPGIKEQRRLRGLKLIRTHEEEGMGTKTGREKHTAEAKATDRKQESAVMWKQNAQEVWQRRGEKWDVAPSCCQSQFQHKHTHTLLLQRDSLQHLRNKASRWQTHHVYILMPRLEAGKESRHLFLGWRATMLLVWGMIQTKWLGGGSNTTIHFRGRRGTTSPLHGLLKVSQSSRLFSIFVSTPHAPTHRHGEHPDLLLCDMLLNHAQFIFSSKCHYFLSCV